MSLGVANKIDTPAVAITTEVSHPKTQAHVPLGVVCRATDADGAPIDTLATEVFSNDPHVTVVGHTVASDIAGSYRVFCRLKAPAYTSDVKDAVNVHDVLGARIVVTPACAQSWRVHLYKQGPCFTQARLPLTWDAYDAFGNAIDNFAAELKATPDHGIRRDDSGGYVFSDEGTYDIVLTPLGEGRKNLAPFKQRITVDSTPPKLVITAPARSATLVSQNDSQRITGTVVDSLSDIVKVRVANQAVHVDANSRDVTFAVEQPTTWGLNIIDATAEDACGNVSQINQSYLISPSFAPAAYQPNVEARLNGAVQVGLSQALWDDGARDTRPSVASLLETALASNSLNGRLPHLLGSIPEADHDGQLPQKSYSCGFYTKKHAVSGVVVTRNGPIAHNAVKVLNLSAVDGGWDVSFAFTDIKVPIALTRYQDLGCLGGTHLSTYAAIAADDLRVKARLSVRLVDDVPIVEICKTCINVEFKGGQARLVFDSLHGRANFFHVGDKIESFINWLSQSYLRQVAPALEQKIRDEATTQMAAFLAGLRLEHSLPMPKAIGGAVHINSGLDSLTLKGPLGEGFGAFSLYSQAYPSALRLQPIRPDVVVQTPILGPIRHVHRHASDIVVTPPDSFALSVHDDLLNQMLWAMWAGGAFSHTDLRRVMAGNLHEGNTLLDAATLSVFFTLPPVVMPAAQEREIWIGVGDTYAEADVDFYALFGFKPPTKSPTLRATFYFSMRTRAKLDVDAAGRHLVVTPVETPRVRVQVISCSSPTMVAATTYILEKLVNQTVPRLLADQLGTFPLPALQVERLPGVAKNTAWVLGNSVLERAPHADAFVLRGVLRSARAR